MSVRSVVARLGRRRLAALATGLLALVVLGWYGARWARKPAPMAYAFVAGERRVYELEYVSASASDLTALLGADTAARPAAQVFHTSVQAELVVTVLSADGDGARLAYQLVRPGVRLASGGELLPEKGEAVAAQLAGTVAVADVAPSGRIRAVTLDPALDELTAGYVRALLAGTQVVLPGAVAASWEVEEDDANGTCVARYEGGPRGKGLVAVRKTKLRYAEVAEAPSAHEFRLPLAHEPAGEVEATVDPGRAALVSLRGTEVTTVRVGGRTVARAENTLRLSLLRQETASGDDLAGLRARAPAGAGRPLASPDAGEAGEAALHAAELGEDTADTLLARLPSVEDGKDDGAALYLKLKALVYLDRAASGRLVAPLTAAKAGGRTLGMLAQALAGSGRKEAQAALAQVVRARRGDAAALQELLPALGMAKNPTPEAEKVLWEMARAADRDVMLMAQLALGSMARGLAATGPARAEAIVDWAVAELGRARGAEARRHLLLVLGNAGSARALPAVRRHLADADPGVRGAAVGALRWLGGDEVEAALCRALVGDGDADVRLEAAHAFEYRPMTAAALKAHAAALRGDRSPSVRLAALANVARARAAFPEAEALVRAAAKDPVQEVREAAAELLGADEGE